MILLYHRVAEAASDPWELAVTPQHFREHIELLQTLGPIRPLSELGNGDEAGPPADVSFAVTFDDGYADNLHAAKPILEEHDAPATVFVTTEPIGGRPFWWDELADLILDSTDLPRRLELELGGAATRWEAVDERRQAVYEEVWAGLQPLPEAERSGSLDSLRSQIEAGRTVSPRSLTRDELAELARDGLVDIGAHTRTHPVLSRLGASAAEDEIRGSKSELEELLDRPVRAFSYPFGGTEHYGEREVRIVREAGFGLACSAMTDVITRATDRLQLPRMTIGSWDVGRLERSLSRILGTTR